MKTLLTTLAAGLALSGALAAAPALAQETGARCTGSGALCFMLQDRPATARELGIPATTGSVALLPDCERWSAVNGARQNFRGLCSDGSAQVSTPSAPDPQTPDPGGRPGGPGDFTANPGNPQPM